MQMRTNMPGVAGEQSFDEFFAEVWPWAFRLAAFLTHDTAAGEDIAQDALAKMAERWGSADVPAAYLRRTLVNASSNWHRHNRTVVSKLPMLLSDAHAATQFDELADAIARLPFRQRTVIVLRYYGDQSESEIADALGCRPGTVKSLCSRALATLSKEITR